MNKYRKFLGTIINILIIVILIWLRRLIEEPSQIAIRRMELPKGDIYRMLIRLNMVAIGIAIEGKRLIKGIKRKLNINWFGLLIAIFFILLSMTPILLSYRIGMNTVGYNFSNPIRLISYVVERGITWNVVSLLGGIAIVRSITKGE